ncbi:UDP-N-acetylmuramoyl-tripeptide--D-alanyl-D-alanine ligase [Hathewaya massiliensis]|uniref:UDP-N-acetylmuramoyl-tripeptide--D-alanyl-D- alanine ligase n=1 Tax=Hathewaya massiliensis TaxID=1964382 RepID=UPI001158DD80|nr:UDP-N-acetylmuramoyl-tripeptide--D-alanyl-D-alanine ligase [Hathewaya massiliensis]
METLTLKEILEATKGELIKSPNIEKFSNLSTDTRTIKEKSIFVALKGERFNGNMYIKEAELKGASLCIVDEVVLNEDELKSFNAGIIKVKDTKHGLMDMAAYYLKKLNVKVIGITGSTGKTSTKDLTAAALSGKYKVFKTEGNFNNEIGLPLTILSMDSTYEVAVLEMGMSNFGEIHNLASVAKPHIGIITNIGVSHLENLKTRENILKAKMEITDFFNKDNILILNHDNDILSTVDDKNDYKLIRIGINSSKHGLNYKAHHIIIKEDGIKFSISENNQDVEEVFEINALGMHSVLNSQLAIATARVLGLNFDEIRNGFKNIKNTSMRLQIINNEDIKIINDSYNASPDSMKAAIEYLRTLNGKRKVAILGTMKELGEDSYELHRDVAKFAKEKGIHDILCIGEFSKAYIEGFGDGALEFSNKEELGKYYNNLREKGDIVLVKASRSMQFEDIVNYIDKLHS